MISRQFLIGYDPDTPLKYKSVNHFLVNLSQEVIIIQINLYVPIMSIMEFIFIVSWMKVAEALLNPLGEDDDDLELNFLIDKNISVSSQKKLLFKIVQLRPSKIVTIWRTSV